MRNSKYWWCYTRNRAITNVYEKLKVWNSLKDKTDEGGTNQCFDKRLCHLKGASNINMFAVLFLSISDLRIRPRKGFSMRVWTVQFFNGLVFLSQT